MTQQFTPPIYLRPDDPARAETPFSGDAFERKELADRLTKFLSRLPDGGVLAIDAPWGEGKTWFGKHWHADLVRSGHRSIYIDCFASDFVDDPFVMIAGELLDLVNADQKGTRARFFDAGKKLGAALLPAVAKTVVNAAGHWAIGNSRLAEDVTTAFESLQDQVSDRLESLGIR